MYIAFYIIILLTKNMKMIYYKTRLYFKINMFSQI